METVQQINEIILVDCQRLNQQFIKEAITEWDKVGEGCFQMWINVMLAQKWLTMIRSN